jgi:hypothetical protein
MTVKKGHWMNLLKGLVFLQLLLSTTVNAKVHHYGSHNTEFAVFASRSLPKSVDLKKMTLEEISDFDSKEGQIIRNAVLEAAKKTLYPLLLQTNFVDQANLTEILLASGEKFTTQLKESLREKIKKGELQDDYTFRLLLSPIRSDKLQYRNSSQGQTDVYRSRPYYSFDKFPLYDLSNNNQMEQSLESTMLATRVTNGVSAFLDEQLIFDDKEKRIENPYFVSSAFPCISGCYRTSF